MPKLTVQVRTKNELSDLLATGESPAWRVGKKKEPRITHVRVVNWDGNRMIEGAFDRRASYRCPNGRLVIGFANARIVDCDIKFDTRNPVRYVDA